MDYILNKPTYYIHDKKYNYNFTFLKNMSKYINVELYYNILNTCCNRKLNNIYNIIYIFWTKNINNKFINIKNIIIPKGEKKLTSNQIDTLLLNFIEDKKDEINKYCKSIILINIITSSLI
jgi:hypothetical protein